MKQITIEISSKDKNKRLDKFLKEYQAIPFALIQKLIRTKDIRVNGARTSCSYLLQEQDIISIKYVVSQMPLTKRKPNENLKNSLSDVVKQRILFMDSYILAIDKPYDIAVQGGNKIKISIDDILPELKFEYDEAPKLVHRLDRHTSGLLILARTKEIAQIIMKLFQEKQIQKKYIALVTGKPKEDSGILKMYIKKNTFGNVEKMSEDSDGKESITEYRVIQNFSDKASLVEFSPITGRMHQIRIHASECLNCPIIGDIKYGGKKSTPPILSNCNKLHLAAIEIFIPNIHGKKYHIECPVPEHIQESIDELTKLFH